MCSTQVGLRIVLTWLKGLFQALVVGPVLRVPLLESPVDLRSLLRPLQLQQQLSYTHTLTNAYNAFLVWKFVIFNECIMVGVFVLNYLVRDSQFTTSLVGYAMWPKQLQSKQSLYVYYSHAWNTNSRVSFTQNVFGNEPIVFHQLQQHYYSSHCLSWKDPLYSASGRLTLIFLH